MTAQGMRLGTLRATLAGAALAAFCGTPVAASDLVRWGSSELGAGSQTTIAAMASVVAANSKLKVIEQITGGPAENMRLLHQGEIELGQLTSGIAYDGFHGRGNYAAQGKTDLLGVMTIYPSNMTLAVSAKSGMRKVEDLKGKRIAVGPPGSAGPRIMIAWLKAYGVADTADLVQIGYAEGTNALRAGTVDATFIFGTGNAPSGFTQELDLAMDIVPIEWGTEGEGFKRLQTDAPEMAVPGKLQKGVLKNLDRDIQVPGTYSVQYSTGRLSEEAAYQLVKGVWDNRNDIAGRVALAKWYTADPANLLVGLDPSIPVHPGAVRFFKETGVWNDKYKIGSVRK
jgi:TRAP transporter TAXI family solute receptor